MFNKVKNKQKTSQHKEIADDIEAALKFYNSNKANGDKASAASNKTATNQKHDNSAIYKYQITTTPFSTIHKPTHNTNVYSNQV